MSNKRKRHAVKPPKQQPSSHPDKDKAPPRENEQKASDDANALKREMPGSPDKPLPQSSSGHRIWDWLLEQLPVLDFLLSILTLVVVAIYAGFTYWQAHSTQDLVTISQRQQRPYLWARPIPKNPGGIIFRQYPAATGTEFNNLQYAIEVGVEILNSGLSPAISVNTTTPNLTFMPTDLFIWERVKGQYLEYPKPPGMGVIPANSSILVNGSPQGTDGSGMQGIWGGRTTVFAVGKVSYTDVYHPNELPYETTYCFFLKPVPPIPNPGGPQERDTVGSCPFGNSFR